MRELLPVAEDHRCGLETARYLQSPLPRFVLCHQEFANCGTEGVLQQLTLKKSTASLFDRRRLRAIEKFATGTPSWVNLSSGSRVRLPAKTTRLKLTI